MVVEAVFDVSEESGVYPTRLLEEVGALLHGNFILASGKQSDYYFDSKKLTLDPRGAHFIAKHLVRKLDELGIRYVGGTAYSAIPIAANVALFSDLREGEPIRAFYCRKEAKAHGTKAQAEGQLPPQGTPVAILEDVVTTGDSVLEAIDKAEANDCTVTHAITLVDRNEGGRQAVEDRGYKFWSLFRVERSGDKVKIVFNCS